MAMSPEPPSRPLLVFDGDCAFCRLWIERWRRITGDAVEFAAYQDVAGRFPEIPAADFAAAVHLRDADGRWTRGAAAVFRSLATAGGAAGLGLLLYRHVPGFAAIAEAAYRLIARRRPLFLALTRGIWGRHVTPPGERLTIAIFLRALGVVTTIAFVSLWIQIAGLVGSNGILPIGAFLDAAAQQVGPSRFWLLPTLSWIDASDASLHLQCALGTLSGVLLAAGVAPRVCVLAAAGLYLSLAAACRDFLWFQWDGLLIETLCLALFAAPPGLRMRPDDAGPSRLGLWLLRWLLFRLMVSSALVKLASGDPAWRDLTALQYHYETQCLPPWTAWYAHGLPPAFHRASALAMYAIEGLSPWLVLAPRRLRFAGAAAIALLQIVILATGNYGFFNLLALALCVPWLDDGVWPRRGAPLPEPRRRRASWAARLAGAALVLLSLAPTLRGAGLGRLVAPLLPAYAAISPLRIVNAYGLFAVMTRRRDEVIVLGSDDGVAWRAYEFRWKPGDPARRPAFATPHMPRVDWQMWFVPLDGQIEEPWLSAFAERLLQGAPAVRRLLAGDPFAGRPPRYLRVTLYHYRFTAPAERRASGAWWAIERLEDGPVWTLVSGRLARIEEAALPGPERP